MYTWGTTSLHPESQPRITPRRSRVELNSTLLKSVLNPRTRRLYERALAVHEVELQYVLGTVVGNN